MSFGMHTNSDKTRYLSVIHEENEMIEICSQIKVGKSWKRFEIHLTKEEIKLLLGELK